MTKYVIDMQDGPAVEFDGALIAFASSQEGARARDTGRWTELAAYKTDTGKYVLVVTGKSKHPDEVDLNKLYVEDSIQDLGAHLRYNRLAKSLADQLGIEQDTVKL